MWDDFGLMWRISKPQQNRFPPPRQERTFPLRRTQGHLCNGDIISSCSMSLVSHSPLTPTYLTNGKVRGRISMNVRIVLSPALSGEMGYSLRMGGKTLMVLYTSLILRVWLVFSLSSPSRCWWVIRSAGVSSSAVSIHSLFFSFTH